MVPPARLAGPLVAAALLASAPFAAAAGPATPAFDGQAMQFVADAVVIDARCRTASAMFGAVFRYGEAHGIGLADVMLAGRWRRQFQAAYDHRFATTPREELCGSLLARYQEAFPNWFTTR